MHVAGDDLLDGFRFERHMAGDGVVKRSTEACTCPNRKILSGALNFFWSNVIGRPPHGSFVFVFISALRASRAGEDFLSDMYSLGGTLYHAITGHVPFEAETIEQVVAGHVHTPLTPPMNVNPRISEATNEAICITLAKKPERTLRHLR